MQTMLGLHIRVKTNSHENFYPRFPDSAILAIFIKILHNNLCKFHAIIFPTKKKSSLILFIVSVSGVQELN